MTISSFSLLYLLILRLILKDLITELQCLCYNGGLCLFVGSAFVFVGFFFIDVMTAAENICSFRVVKFKSVFVYDFFNCFISYSNKDFIIYCVWFFSIFLFPNFYLIMSFYFPDLHRFFSLISSLILVRFTFFSFSLSVSLLFSTSTWFLLLFQV